jgi:3-oxoacyl-[acyl-carrier protein] reductase
VIVVMIVVMVVMIVWHAANIRCERKVRQSFGCGLHQGRRPANVGQTSKLGERMKAADLFDLTGQVALVTGASSGLGVRFAEVLAANGAAVVLVARRRERLAALEQRIAAAGGRALAVEADVTNRAAMAAAFGAAEAAFGTVTILLNNAGIAQEARRAVDVADDEWRRVLDTNLDAAFAWAREAARRMLAAGKPGSIVNLASVLGFGVTKGTLAYAVSKAAVVQLTKSLAVELAFKNVRVNAIAPGWFVTEINRDYLESERGSAMTREIPMGRFGQEGDLDGALLLLASNAGRYMAGATVVVDGGQLVQLRA